MNADECIRGRRSVRSYKEEAVSEEEIRDIVETTRFAPSWANTQCVRYLVVRNTEVKGRLAEIMSDKNPARKAVREGPVVVVFLAKRGLAGHKNGEAVDDRPWHLFDAGGAVQTFCLAAHERGLGTVIVGYFDAAAAAEILGIPPGFDVVAFTPLGRPAQTPPAPPRKSVDALLSWESFQEA